MAINKLDVPPHTKEQMENLFELPDKNHDGRLTQAELIKAFKQLQRLGLPSADTSEINNFVTELDTSGDNFISKSEWLTHFNVQSNSVRNPSCLQLA